jgi:hypothetical protein
MFKTHVIIFQSQEESKIMIFEVVPIILGSFYCVFTWMMFRLLQEQIEIEAAWHDSISQQFFQGQSWRG